MRLTLTHRPHGSQCSGNKWRVSSDRKWWGSQIYTRKTRSTGISSRCVPLINTHAEDEANISGSRIGCEEKGRQVATTAFSYWQTTVENIEVSGCPFTSRQVIYTIPGPWLPDLFCGLGGRRRPHGLLCYSPPRPPPSPQKIIGLCISF